MTAEGAFRLAVRIASDLGDEHVERLREILSCSNAEEILVRKAARSGVYWKLDFGRAGRPETLIRRLIDHGDELAHAIAHATEDQGDTVSVTLCQEIDDIDDSQQKGIWFPPEAVRWATLAGASIDIDQYIYAD